VLFPKRVHERVLLSVNAARHSFVTKNFVFNCLKTILSVNNIQTKKKQVFFDGLNRLENPARTCTSSNLPCGHVIRDNITLASPRKCKYFFFSIHFDSLFLAQKCAWKKKTSEKEKEKELN